MFMIVVYINILFIRLAINMFGIILQLGASILSYMDNVNLDGHIR